MNNGRRPLTFILVAAFAGFLVYAASHSKGIRQNVARRDSIQYWAGANLLINHHNPYDIDKVFELERLQGYEGDRPLVIRTPPWSLFMFLPFGVLSAFWAWALWIILSLICLITAMRSCWNIFAAESGARRVFTLAGYIFAPVPACLVAGQMGLLLLLGIILFMKYESRRPFLAGAALILPFAKPHLLALFWLVLLLWIIAYKKFAVLAGLAAAFVLANLLALGLDHRVFQDYRDFLPRAAIAHEFIPAVSGVIRALFFHRMFWVQFVPLAVALLWSLRYFLKKRETWDWRYHGLILMVVSVLTTPYAWLSDEVVLLPAILQATLWIYSSRHTLRIRDRLAIFGFCSLNALLLLILYFKIPFSTGIYLWSSLVWFGGYIYASRFQSPLLERA